MSDKPNEIISSMEGRAALPRKNGELVFENPWQARIFAIAVRLSELGLYEWDEFRQELIHYIQISEKEVASGEKEDPCKYYENWLASLRELLKKKLVINDEELVRRLDLITLEAAKDGH